MTLDEFIEKLKGTRGAWQVRDNNTLRTRADCRCPIIAISGKNAPNLFYDVMGRELGLKDADARRIAFAADNHPTHDRALRTRLLQAVGLEP